MSKRTPPSDDIPLARRCAFQASVLGSTRQLEACQPGGNGTNGQIVSLSLAAFGGSWAGVFAVGTGAVGRNARHRCAHCKFIVVAPKRSTHLKKRVGLKINAHPQNGALSNRACILEKSAPAFNWGSPLAPEK